MDIPPFQTFTFKKFANFEPHTLFEWFIIDTFPFGNYRALGTINFFLLCSIYTIRKQRWSEEVAVSGFVKSRHYVHFVEFFYILWLFFEIIYKYNLYMYIYINYIKYPQICVCPTISLLKLDSCEILINDIFKI